MPAPLLGRYRRHRSHGGFSLIEMMIAIVVMGLLLAIMAPRLTPALTSVNLRNARGAVVNLYGQARSAAIQSRKVATLQFNGSKVWITVPQGAGVDTIGGVMDVSTEYGVTMSASGNLTVQPTGLVNAAVPVVITLTKNSRADTLTISGYGRLK